MAERTPLDLAPSDGLERTSGSGRILLLACGALGREIVDLVEANNWQAFDIQCLPAKWHNTPEMIVPALREKIRANRNRYQGLYVLYGDCGTGGMLDAMLAEEGVERIEGPHCYSFFSGNAVFRQTADDDVTAFFLTDYLARHFDKLVWQGLGLDRHPELLPAYFGNYTKIVYLAQTRDSGLEDKAKAAAERLGLAYEYRFTGYGELAAEMAKRA
ncbi:MAG: DUF1638 domain-containing protein [Rhizobiales bacterium]|nr:DUF1638 domain-containing protein [Hyphomicrobiales bacterium]